MIEENQIQELDFDITQYHKCGGELYWYGCYEGDGYYKQYFEPSTYAHPAKISPLLTERIFKHLEQLGLLKEGMTILDFMAGSGRVPLLASLKGYKSIGVELEPHFTKMCEDNKKFAENKIGRKLDMTTIQGDSRQLSKLLKSSDIGIVSPPFTDMCHKTNYLGKLKKESCSEYSNNPENIGNLPYRDIVAVVSPPFQDQNQGTKPLSERNDGLALQLKKDRPNTYNKTGVGSSSKEYSDNPNNIGNLPYKEMVGIVSPPYQDNPVPLAESNIGARPEIWKNKIKSIGYSQNPQNIGNLPDKPFSFESRRDKDTGKFLPYTSQDINNLRDIRTEDLLSVKLTQEQLQVIYGTLLGDGSLSRGGTNRKDLNTFYLQVVHAESQKDYVIWKFNIFKNICNVVEPKLRGNTTSWGFTTRKHPYFSDIYPLIYKDRKYVNRDFLNLLEPLGLAVWFMDDCSSYHEKYIDLATCCFTDEEQQIIIDYFKEKWDLECYTKLKNDYKILYFPKKDAYKLSKILEPYILPSMKYKFCFDNSYHTIPIVKDKEFVGITSPPYAHDSIISVTNKSDLVKEKFDNIPYSDETIDYESRRNLITGRFDSANFENIGRLKDSQRPEGQENYLSAMLQVYKEASKVCPVICTITKNPTRAGKLRRLDLDTAKLLELSGYKIIDYHRAVLFKTFEQQTLTGSTKKEYKGRLSFFKRLSLQKGNTASEWEDIIIGVKNV